MNKNERIVCEFLRKIAPSREWEYLGEVEHCWIGELCDELNKQLEAENAKLRNLLLDVWNDAMQFDGFWDYVHDDGKIYNEDELPHYQERMRELGVEVE